MLIEPEVEPKPASKRRIAKPTARTTKSKSAPKASATEITKPRGRKKAATAETTPGNGATGMLELEPTKPVAEEVAVSPKGKVPSKQETPAQEEAPVAKTTRPRRKRTTPSTSDSDTPELKKTEEAAAKPVPVEVSPAQPAAEEWRPSRRRSAVAEPEPAASTPSPAVPTEDPAPANPTPAAPPSGPRQYPVYIPRHVAKQLEQSGQPAPVAVTAEVAATMPIIAAAAAAAASAPPPQHPHHHEHHHHHHRQHRSDAAANQAVQDLPPIETLRTEVSPEDDLGIAEGIVEISGKGFGFIRDPKKGFTQNPSDIFVTPEIARSFNLRDGQWIKGHTRRGNRGAQLYKLLEVNGEEPEKSRDQPPFEELTVVSPLEKFTLETVPDRFTTRIMDLMAPIGKGQRGLIVAPPRTGKTTLLQHIADAVVKNHPETKFIILLVDERPEEVTDIRRTVPSAELMASSNDMDVKSHTRIAQLAIERAKRLCEAGKDVFVLLDSITRVGRAFNNSMSGGGRTMSGGVDARALEIPRRLFAAARNTEEAGSLTVVATALIETGSRMDDLIFQEFKGTGNMELVLDRKISDQRIYPAIDIFLSGTRREELLIPADDLHKIGVIRRGLSGYKPMEAIERMIFFMKKFPTNAEMLKNIPG